MPPFKAILRPALLTALSITAGSTAAFLYTVNRKLFDVKSSTIRVADKVSPSCASSRSVSVIVNPKNHVAFQQELSVELPSMNRKQEFSDEQVLAIFVKGFFGGCVLMPERIVLRCLGKRLVRLQCDHAAEKEVWSARRLSPASLPPVGSIIFGAFQILDIGLRLGENVKVSETTDGSYVDFGYGSKTFAGVHRFLVKRNDEHGITIQFSNVTCNPVENKMIGPSLIITFHQVYARLLFREGVAEVKRAMGRI